MEDIPCRPPSFITVSLCLPGLRDKVDNKIESKREDTNLKFGSTGLPLTDGSGDPF